jgi:SAM-dependent methyltransferase
VKDVKPASDALEWSDCEKGTVWNLLGQEVIRAAIAEKVLFLPAVVQHARARDWLSDPARGKLALALKMAKARNIRFDYAILQQGCSDVGTDSREYLNDMRRVIRWVSLTVRPEKWLVSQSANCPGPNGGRLRAVQVQIGRNPVFNTFQGADATKLSAFYHAADGTLNEAGRQRLADLWLDALKRAELSSAQYQRETLLYYFK